MNISVIIPAYNAADTIAETLESLRTQKLTTWEAIVVDDGSTDDTVTIVQELGAQDVRIRLVTQSNQGSSSARNTGIRHAHFDWVLFLDADDWLLPNCLELMAKALKVDPTCDMIAGAWVRVNRDGKPGPPFPPPTTDVLFAELARYNPMAVHSCAVRKDLLTQLGAFNTNFKICHDWDFWQRVARMGAKVGRVTEVIAGYRTRPGSQSLVNGALLLDEGFRLIEQGHAPDPRVPQPDPAYANGLPSENLATARLHYVCWVAGLMLASQQSTDFLLEAIANDVGANPDPGQVAAAIYDAMPLPQALPGSQWPELWSATHAEIRHFLRALETQTQAPDLARRSLRYLHRLLLYTRVIALYKRLFWYIPFSPLQVLGRSTLLSKQINKYAAFAWGKIFGQYSLDRQNA